MPRHAHSRNHSPSYARRVNNPDERHETRKSPPRRHVPPLFSGDETAKEQERMRKLEALRSNAAALAHDRLERVKEFESELAKEAQEAQSTPAGGSTHVGEMNRIAFGADGADTIGSTMSSGALHDRIRRKMHTLHRGDSLF
jgi:hypothetical protein